MSEKKRVAKANTPLYMTMRFLKNLSSIEKTSAILALILLVTAVVYVTVFNYKIYDIGCSPVVLYDRNPIKQRSYWHAPHIDVHIDLRKDGTQRCICRLRFMTLHYDLESNFPSRILVKSMAPKVQRIEAHVEIQPYESVLIVGQEEKKAQATIVEASVGGGGVYEFEGTYSLRPCIAIDLNKEKVTDVVHDLHRDFDAYIDVIIELHMHKPNHMLSVLRSEQKVKYYASVDQVVYVDERVLDLNDPYKLFNEFVSSEIAARVSEFFDYYNMSSDPIKFMTRKIQIENGSEHMYANVKIVADGKILSAKGEPNLHYDFFSCTQHFKQHGFYDGGLARGEITFFSDPMPWLPIVGPTAAFTIIGLLLSRRSYKKLKKTKRKRK